MPKSKISFAVDALMMLCVTAIAGLGFLYRHMAKGDEALGSQFGLFWLGRGRHEWAELHFFLGIAFLVFLTLHLILHWSQIVALHRGLVSAKTARWVIAIAFALICLALIGFSLVAKPEVRDVRGRRDAAGVESVSEATPLRLDSGPAVGR